MKRKAPELYTARLILREITLADTETIVQWRSDPGVYQFFLSPHPLTAERHINWFENLYSNNENRFDWMAFDKENHSPIGVFSVKRESRDVKTAEVSYLVDSEKGRKGYASEAVNELLCFVRKQWGCDTAVAQIHQKNDKSIRFIEKLGFEQGSMEESFIVYSKTL